MPVSRNSKFFRCGWYPELCSLPGFHPKKDLGVCAMDQFQWLHVHFILCCTEWQWNYCTCRAWDLNAQIATFVLSALIGEFTFSKSRCLSAGFHWKKVSGSLGHKSPFCSVVRFSVATCSLVHAKIHNCHIYKSLKGSKRHPCWMWLSLWAGRVIPLFCKSGKEILGFCFYSLFSSSF